MDAWGYFCSWRKSSWSGFCWSLQEINAIPVWICSFFYFHANTFCLLTRFTSFCFRRNLDLVETLSRPISNSKELSFPTKYSQTSLNQFLACLWKQNLSYWRNPQYTAVKFFYTVIISLMLGTICWKFGAKRFLL